MVEEIKKTTTEKKEEKVVETQKVEDKKQVVKKIEPVKKDKAVVNAYSLPISTKNSSAICKMIKGKSPERAIEMLEKVLLKKLAVPMRGYEVPHRKRSLLQTDAGGPGRFPLLAAKEFINLLKQLKANCEVNNVENPFISLAVANIASRPRRREGRKSKRTNIYLEAKSKTGVKK